MRDLSTQANRNTIPRLLGSRHCDSHVAIRNRSRFNSKLGEAAEDVTKFTPSGDQMSTSHSGRDEKTPIRIDPSKHSGRDQNAKQDGETAREVIVGGQRFRLVPVEQIDAPERRSAGTLLTGRELQIVALVAEGRVNKQIASDLHISEWTVSTHLRRIFCKLGVDTRAAMVSRCSVVLTTASSDRNRNYSANRKRGLRSVTAPGSRGN